MHERTHTVESGQILKSHHSAFLSPQEENPVCPVPRARFFRLDGESFDQPSKISGRNRLFVHEDDAGMGISLLRPSLQHRRNRATIVRDKSQPLKESLLQTLETS